MINVLKGFAELCFFLFISFFIDLLISLNIDFFVSLH